MVFKRIKTATSIENKSPLLHWVNNRVANGDAMHDDDTILFSLEAVPNGFEAHGAFLTGNFFF